MPSKNQRRSTWQITRDLYGDTLGPTTNRARLVAMEHFAGLEQGERDYVLAQLLYLDIRARAEGLVTLDAIADSLEAGQGEDAEPPASQEAEAPEAVAAPPAVEPAAAVRNLRPTNGPAAPAAAPAELLDASGRPVA